MVVSSPEAVSEESAEDDEVDTVAISAEVYVVDAKVMVTYLSIVEVTSVSLLKDVVESVPLSYLRKGMAVAKEARLKIVARGKIIILGEL